MRHKHCDLRFTKKRIHMVRGTLAALRETAEFAMV